MQNKGKSIERIKKDSRKHQRIAVYLNIHDSKVPKLKGHNICSYNLSLGGMMIVITPPATKDTPLSIGEKIELSFAIDTNIGSVALPSQIVWVKELVLTPENEQATCAGVKFLDAPGKIQNMINDFLEGKTKKEDETQAKKTCRDCIHFKENAGSKYAFCKLHRITILNSTEDLTLSFNQIFSHPCKDLKEKK